MFNLANTEIKIQINNYLYFCTYQICKNLNKPVILSIGSVRIHAFPYSAGGSAHWNNIFNSGIPFLAIYPTDTFHKYTKIYMCNDIHCFKICNSKKQANKYPYTQLKLVSKENKALYKFI